MSKPFDIHTFRNPDASLRPVVLWGINDGITPEEMARQLSGMIDVGLGRAFLNA